MLTRRTIERADDEMRDVSPERAAVSDLAGRIHDHFLDWRGREAGLTLDTDAWAGRETSVTIPNGLTGEQRRERRCTVTVTAEMVAEAKRLAETF